MGSQSLKNIAQTNARLARPYRPKLFAGNANKTADRDCTAAYASQQTLHRLLPFPKQSSNAKQKYFADGMVEEIITALCASSRSS